MEAILLNQLSYELLSEIVKKVEKENTISDAELMR